MTFLECLRAKKGDLFRASELYCKSRRWHRDEWYTNWQTTDLPNEVERAVVEYYK